MKNELLKLGPFVVHGYGLMIAIGIIAAYLSAEYRAKKMNMEYEKIFNLTIWCALGGIAGAKVLYYLTSLPKIIEDPSLLLDVANGFVVYGGIIGGILAGYIYCRRQKLKFLAIFDLVMPSIALAQGFGRIGCLLAGCCYGLQTSSSFSLIFKDSAYAPNGVRLIPTQPLSSILDFLNCFVLIWFSKRKKADGQVAGLYLVFYSIGRFILEFFRGDLVRGSIGPLSTSQFISIFILIAGILLIVVTGRRKTEEKEAAPEEEVSDSPEIKA